MITVTGLTKEFRSGRGRVQALSDISFHVARGQHFVILGKSGSGKSTLLNCLGGLEQPDTGRVVCSGHDLARMSARDLASFQRRRVGFVFQFGNLLSYLTVHENLSLPLAMNGVTGLDRDHRITELLESIGLTGIGPALPRELSGGEIQRVAFARAIAHRPSILLADEPTASLDSATGDQLIRLMFDLGRLWECTVVVATHDHDIIGLADATLVLRDGRQDERG